MNTPTFDPDDPRLTAYALGESGPEESEAFERLLAASPEARAEVERTVALAHDLEAEYRRENEAYWDTRRTEPLPGKIVAFPNGRQARWKPLAWKIAAVLAVLAALAPLALRRAPLVQTASLTPPPPAATNPPPPAAAPPPAEAVPAASTLAQASAPADADSNRPPASAPEPAAAASTPNIEALLAMDDNGAAHDKITAPRAANRPISPAFDSAGAVTKPTVRHAVTAATPPGASAADAYATSTGGATDRAVDRISRSLVRIRTGDGSCVAGVAITTEGKVLAACPLSDPRSRPTVILADGREVAAMISQGDADARLCQVQVAEKSLPIVAFATSVPADKGELTVASTDRHTGATRYLRALAVSSGAEVRLRWTDQPPSDDETSLVFNSGGELLEVITTQPTAKAETRSRSASYRAGRAEVFLRPFTAAERARLLNTEQGRAR